jgi:hypothetical protein
MSTGASQDVSDIEHGVWDGPLLAADAESFVSEDRILHPTFRPRVQMRPNRAIQRKSRKAYTR